MEAIDGPQMATRRRARASAFANALRIDDVPEVHGAQAPHVAHVLVYCDGAADTEDSVARVVTLLGAEPCGRALSSLMGWQSRPVSANIVASDMSVIVNGTTFTINETGTDHVILLGVDFFVAITHDNRQGDA